MKAFMRRAWDRLKQQHLAPDLGLSDADKAEWGPLLDCGHRSHSSAKDTRTGVTSCLDCYPQAGSPRGRGR